MIKKYVLRPLFTHLTAGETLTSLESKVIQLHKQNIYPIVDYIKESSNTSSSINSCILQHIKLSQSPNIEYVALKLSSFGFRENKIDYVVNTLIQKEKKVMIDAEEVDKHDQINEITYNLIKKYNTNQDINIFKTYQMYRKDGYNTLKNDINKVENLGIKLVRGAYYKQDYMSNKLFMHKDETDLAYSNAMSRIFSIIKYANINAFICTHNYYDNTKLIDFNNNNNLTSKLFHASLYGFINKDTQRIIKSGIPVFKYLPYGNFDDSIPYLTRRLYENPKILYYLLK